MWLGILWIVLSKFSYIFWKKALNIGGSDLYRVIFKFFTAVNSVIISLVFVLLWFFEFALFSHYLLLGLLVVVMVFDLIRTPLKQKLYRENKMSTLIPYENLNKIFIVIISFFLFGDVSWLTLSIALLTIFVIMWFTLDFKTIKFPKSFGIVVLIQLIYTVNTLIAGYILLSISAITLFVSNNVLMFLGLWILLLSSGTRFSLKKLSREFYINRYSASFLGMIPTYISLFLMKSLGVVTTLILSFLWVVVGFWFSVFFLNEKMNKKSIILAVIVSVLVGIGLYFG